MEPLPQKTRSKSWPLSGSRKRSWSATMSIQVATPPILRQLSPCLSILTQVAVKIFKTIWLTMMAHYRSLSTRSNRRRRRANRRSRSKNGWRASRSRKYSRSASISTVFACLGRRALKSTVRIAVREGSRTSSHRWCCKTARPTRLIATMCWCEKSALSTTRDSRMPFCRKMERRKERSWTVSRRCLVCAICLAWVRLGSSWWSRIERLKKSPHWRSLPRNGCRHGRRKFSKMSPLLCRRWTMRVSSHLNAYLRTRSS